MAATIQTVTVATPEQLETTVSSYIAQGFVVSNRTATSVTMFKNKQFNMVWAIVGFFLCILPLLIYLVSYSTQTGQMVEIRVVTNGEPAAQLVAQSAGGSAPLSWSPDRRWWWDGQSWRDAERNMTPGAVLSQDQKSWWDGENWRAVPGTDAAPTKGSEPKPPDEPRPDSGGQSAEDKS